ncbi:MAG: hypothetical protein Q9M09_05280 [Mariprofundaceae bacterium]|nr:hypothetical protein [Mariprofundaceae bacterium]
MESNNILIVESFNDKFFVEGIKKYLNNIDLIITTPICSIDDYECLDGISLKKLTHKLQELKIRIEKDGVNKVGILLDADNSIDDKIKLINDALSEIGSTITIEQPNKWYACSCLDVDISCHILNLNGKGELETILKNIKSKDSTYADCLEAWKICLATKEQNIDDKQFDKIWVSIYQRYDCCTRKEQKQAARKCSNEASMSKGIWDFSHLSLSDFKDFIRMFEKK